jgi:hypothetical protein
MAGIHLHPHDILDEGIAQIRRFLDRIGNISYLFPEVNTIFERNPYPKGILPHNPVHAFVQGEGTLHVPLDARKLYPSLYQRTDDSVLNGFDPLRTLTEGMCCTSYRIVPWINLLNGDFDGNVSDNGVYDFEGRPVEHWLCPNGPDVAPMWANVIAELASRYGHTHFLIDRIRFPDWAGNEVRPRNLFSCFCRHCRKRMEQSGIDSAKLAKNMRAIAGFLKRRQFAEAVAEFHGNPLIRQWIMFRQESVASFVKRLSDRLSAADSRIELWLDLWPPSYAWLLGQSYRRLTRVSRTLKHFPYHKLGGGADVQGLIEHFADGPRSREEAFRAFLKFFGMNYDLTYTGFRENGFPIRFVQDENDKARALACPGTFIFSGVQMWNIAADDFVRTLDAVTESAADDLIYYCYGWAEPELFEAAGRWSQSNGRTFGKR